MAKQFDNTNTGAFFKNDKKKTDKHPDYTGSLNVEGTEYWLSVWNKQAKDGRSYCSVAITEKDKRRPPKPRPANDKPPMDDEIPF